MRRNLRIAYFAHSLRSDWNNGNAHFLRGLLRNLGELGHNVTIFEPASDWSIEQLRAESGGQQSLQQFDQIYPDLNIHLYDAGSASTSDYWLHQLIEMDIVVVHEWNHPELAHTLLALRTKLSYRLLFHDTHHRASSSPKSIAQFGVDRFDGVLAFGESLRKIYTDRFGISRAWTLHEAADVDVFKPLPNTHKTNDVVWIGNWGDGERSAEIKQFLLGPVAALPGMRALIYGVRYPSEGLTALRQAGILYGGYLPNLSAPQAYAASRLTMHIPRQQYVTQAMTGIPTIRVFEALACGIPLISAPWIDTEHLFRPDDYVNVRDSNEMQRAIELLLGDADAAQAYALRGLETVLTRHTCRHRAEQLSDILEVSFS